MNELYILISVLVILNVTLIASIIILERRHPKDSNDADYYDENGYHIYYDRRIIEAEQKRRDQVPSED
ncbi:hypothetical protein BN938_0394 [Mucinivorans hirudinis]|uniref:YtzI protein n=1 Tax=Mucinivorans hirudinis TaxID=1433126 RepID=A0A060RAT7_9BACT|nr:hypothetical protein BN938_0394 [Mucinivorans hirudinis]